MSLRPCYRKVFPRCPSTDLWRVGVVHRPHAQVVANGLGGAQVTWLQDMGRYRFIADPFGIWQDGQLTVFAEAYDYREKRGEIHYYTYDKAWKIVAQGVALRQKFHLSYPYLLQQGTAIYMLPEAHSSGRLTLYKAKHFPDQWEEVATLLDIPVVDASIIEHAGCWWMFYSPAGTGAMRELCIASADSLTGTWKQHPMNPVRTALDSARPGGTPFIRDGKLCLPVQDCVAGYGAALNILQIENLTRHTFAAHVNGRFEPQQVCAGYADGLHTLSIAGEVTLIDMKRVEHSRFRHLINLQRRLLRLKRKLQA